MEHPLVQQHFVLRVEKPLRSALLSEQCAGVLAAQGLLLRGVTGVGSSGAPGDAQQTQQLQTIVDADSAAAAAAGPAAAVASSGGGDASLPASAAPLSATAGASLASFPTSASSSSSLLSSSAGAGDAGAGAGAGAAAVVWPSAELCNTLLLHLAELFRTGHNQLRVFIMRLFRECFRRRRRRRRSAFARHCAPWAPSVRPVLYDVVTPENMGEVLRRVHIVLYQNDPTARAVGLRLIGSLAAAAAERLALHHAVRDGMSSTHLCETLAGAFAADRICAESTDFARWILPVAIDLAESLETPSAMKIRLLRLLRHMHGSRDVTLRARACCEAVAATHPTESFVRTALQTLTHLARRTLVDIARQVDLLRTTFFGDCRAWAKGLALRCMAELVPSASPFVSFPVRELLDWAHGAAVAGVPVFAAVLPDLLALFRALALRPDPAPSAPRGGTREGSSEEEEEEETSSEPLAGDADALDAVLCFLLDLLSAPPAVCGSEEEDSPGASAASLAAAADITADLLPRCVHLVPRARTALCAFSAARAAPAGPADIGAAPAAVCRALWRLVLVDGAQAQPVVSMLITALELPVTAATSGGGRGRGAVRVAGALRCIRAAGLFDPHAVFPHLPALVRLAEAAGTPDALVEAAACALQCGELLPEHEHAGAVDAASAAVSALARSSAAEWSHALLWHRFRVARSALCAGFPELALPVLREAAAHVEHEGAAMFLSAAALLADAEAAHRERPGDDASLSAFVEAHAHLVAVQDCAAHAPAVLAAELVALRIALLETLAGFEAVLRCAAQRNAAASPAAAAAAAVGEAPHLLSLGACRAAFADLAFRYRHLAARQRSLRSRMVLGDWYAACHLMELAAAAAAAGSSTPRPFSGVPPPLVCSPFVAACEAHAVVLFAPAAGDARVKAAQLCRWCLSLPPRYPSTLFVTSPGGH